MWTAAATATLLLTFMTRDTMLRRALVQLCRLATRDSALVMTCAQPGQVRQLLISHEP